MTIRQSRAHLVGALRAALPPEVTVYEYPPDAAQPPFACLLPGSPYRDPGVAWDSATVGLVVRLVVSGAAGSDASRRLDDLIDAAVIALQQAGVRTEAVAEPKPVEDASALTVDIPTRITYRED